MDMDVKKPNTKLLSTIFGNWSSDGQEPMRILSKTPFSPSQQSNFHQFSLGHLAFPFPPTTQIIPTPPILWSLSSFISPLARSSYGMRRSWTGIRIE
jgi:hypothetical protein